MMQCGDGDDDDDDACLYIRMWFVLFTDMGLMIIFFFCCIIDVQLSIKQTDTATTMTTMTIDNDVDIFVDCVRA